METRTISPISAVSEVINWNPHPRDEIRRLLNSKDLTDAEKSEIQQSAISILGQGIDPSKTEQSSSKTGLVIGRVQSGKTLSFTSVAALARDNGFRMVIAITGTSRQLFEQSLKRFRKDLQIDGEQGYSRWQLYPNPKTESLFSKHLETSGEGSHTILVVVMKHFQRLGHLSNLLKSIPSSKFPTLIIDDEGDQASMNTNVQRNMTSATYAAILKLREVSKPCTFLQYTATPQAPLLISTVDQLSPDYVHILKPGKGYIGGDELFRQQKSRLIAPITDAEIVSQKQKPPESLRSSLRLYLLGVSAGSLNRISGRRTLRSMLVHPSTSQEEHETYKQWVDSIIDEWKGTLSRIFFNAPSLRAVFLGHRILSRP